MTSIADKLNVDFALIHKERKKANEVGMNNLDNDVHVLVIDCYILSQIFVYRSSEIFSFLNHFRLLQWY